MRPALAALAGRVQGPKFGGASGKSNANWHPKDIHVNTIGCHWEQLVAFVDSFGREPEDRVPMPTDEDDDDDDAPTDGEKRISIRVPLETYKQVKSAAKRDHRTMAGWLKALIAKALESPADSPSPSPTPSPKSRRRTRTRKR